MTSPPILGHPIPFNLLGAHGATVTVNPDYKTYFDRFYVCFAGLADGWKAVVNVENKDNWSWFLELLEEDLDCNRENGLTLMSDQHKGLIEVVKDGMPNAEHKQCARHNYENFRKQYFGKIIDKIKSANPNAHKYLMDKNPKTWSRAFFEVDRGYEAIENGFNECFNSVIVSVRHKPLLTMLEAIGVIVLKRINKMREISRKWNPRVCPNIKKRLEWLKEEQRFWHVIPAARNLFEVRSGSEELIVDEGKSTCSCRMWQLSGLPYFHATKWPGQSMYSTVLPLKPKKMLGRPKRKRNRSKGEGGSSTKVSKIGRPRKKQSGLNLDDVDVDVKGGGFKKGGSCESKQSSAGGSKGGACAFGSKRKAVSSVGTQKRQGKKKVETSGFAKWFELQDEPEQTQDDPVQTQDEDQVEQTQEQAKIDLTQVEQTQEQTQDQVQTQEQPQQVTLSRLSARILQRKLGK
ncbi:multidrug resistance-associated protein 5 [Tanacetum coccineum]|uniref:Multidrug resistance-associated protein 5 n=1 Tax=Tanacetum coccineum TaxID=301880 RepID=A0ABQ5IJL5_9ASTR